MTYVWRGYQSISLEVPGADISYASKSVIERTKNHPTDRRNVNASTRMNLKKETFFFKWCMSKKPWINLDSTLAYKMDQDIMDGQYDRSLMFTIWFRSFLFKYLIFVWCFYTTWNKIFSQKQCKSLKCLLLIHAKYRNNHEKKSILYIIFEAAPIQTACQRHIHFMPIHNRRSNGKSAHRDLVQLLEHF